MKQNYIITAAFFGSFNNLNKMLLKIEPKSTKNSCPIDPKLFELIQKMSQAYLRG